MSLESLVGSLVGNAPMVTAHCGSCSTAGTKTANTGCC